MAYRWLRPAPEVTSLAVNAAIEFGGSEFSAEEIGLLRRHGRIEVAPCSSRIFQPAQALFGALAHPDDRRRPSAAHRLCQCGESVARAGCRASEGDLDPARHWVGARPPHPPITHGKPDSGRRRRNPWTNSCGVGQCATSSYGLHRKDPHPTGRPPRRRHARLHGRGHSVHGNALRPCARSSIHPGRSCLDTEGEHAIAREQGLATWKAPGSRAGVLCLCSCLSAQDSSFEP